MNNVKQNKQLFETFNEVNSKLVLSVPLKFKAMILKSIYEKHQRKQVQCLRDTFHLWYIQKNSNQMLKSTIEKMMIAQNQKGFTSSRFFYRLKLLVRKQKQKQQKQIKQKQDQIERVDDSQINCFGMNKNFSEYFESLKNIFSSKLLEYENEMTSNKLIQSKGEFFQNGHRKQVRFKTEGNKDPYYNHAQHQQNSESKISINASSQNSQGLKGNQKQNQRQKQNQKENDKEKIRKLGKKVALTLIKSSLLNSIKRCYFQGFFSIVQNSKNFQAKSKISIMNKQCINALQSIVNDTESHLSIQSHKKENDFVLSQSFLESQSQISFYVPPASIIENQMSQVQYSIDLLSKAISKDEQIQQLYRDFQQQYQQFESISKDFDRFKIRTKNSLFERAHIIENKAIAFWKKLSFEEIRKFSKLRDLKKVILSPKSKVNIETFHQILNKSLNSAKKTMKSIKFSKHVDQEERQSSITSIRMLGDFYPNKTLKQEKRFIKGGIRKQNLLTSNNLSKHQGDDRLVSTYDVGFRNDRIISIQSQDQNLSQQHLKSVNFKLSNPIVFNINRSEFQSEKKQKQEKKIAFVNDPNFYELSTKTIESNESDKDKIYHCEVKSQYWWNNSDSKQNIKQKNLQSFKEI